jgi:hypothetical protein
MNVAWARYGANGFMLAKSMSKTHRRGVDGRTACGVEIPTRYTDDRVTSTSGNGKCRRCFS